jgi:DNA-binding transcriptional LysR family regulator
MNIDTVALQCFIAVAETLSFTKAADRVGRTQSAISQQILKLENLLGHPLIMRGKNPLLTSEGELFLSYARKIYALHRELFDKFKEPELQGEIHFGIPEDFANFILTDVLLEFSRLHPRVILNLECELTKNLLIGFEKKQFDLILIKNNFTDTITNARHICTEAVEWVGMPDRLPELNAGSPIPLVLSPSPCVYRENVIEVLNAAELPWNITYSSPSYAGKMAAVRAGLGITAIQKKLIPHDLQILNHSFLPKLNDIQISLLKANDAEKSVDTLEYFLLKKLTLMV